jgi:uncharacterized membrane protein YhhN
MSRTLALLSVGLFGIISFIHLLSLYLQHEAGAAITKPLLMPLLAFYYLMHSRHQPAAFRFTVLAILFFSLSGDSFLLALRLDPAKEGLFLLGLGSFLVAHLGYLLVFRRLGGKRLAQQKWIFLPFAIYLIGLLWYLWPLLPVDLRFPVAAYGMVITLMALAAIHYSDKLDKRVAQMIIFGALLFIISDSMIALSSFAWKTNLSLGIMITYLGAQWLLINGLSKAKFFL